MDTESVAAGHPAWLLLVFSIINGSIAFASDGFGGSATGGTGGTSIAVTTAAEFASYATSALPYIITVTGTINLGANAAITSNKTIRGADSSATINGDLYIGSGVRNVIVRDLNITNPIGVGDGDGITIFGGRTVLVTHCTFTDCADGECDVTSGADSVTISWCRFKYVTQSVHQNVVLIGSSDSYLSDLGYLHVTIHHCWYDQHCSERMPSVRFGRVHVYNNYYSAAGNNYCARTRLYAECLVENNYFENVQNPWELLTTTGVTGKLRADNNNVSFMDSSYGVHWVSGWYPGQSLIPGIDVVFTPPYNYTPDSVGTVKGNVMAHAGNKGGTTGVGSSSGGPPGFALDQNYPNPFNPKTVIEFRVGSREPVELKVCDVLGREVATLVNEVKQPGTYTVQWNAASVSSGVYYYRIEAGDFVASKKLLLLK